MLVTSAAANISPGSAIPDQAEPWDLRRGGAARSGALFYESKGGSGWHVHDMHQLQYAFEGAATVETREALYFLPPQQAVWIPAGLVHRTRLDAVRFGSVFFVPEVVAEPGDRIRVLGAVPVIKEMIAYAERWPVDRSWDDPRADAFFRVLGDLCLEQSSEERPIYLPVSADPVIARIMEYTRENLQDATITDVCAAVGMSERSLRRHFSRDTGMTWQRYRLHVRLVRAMAILAQDDATILETSVRVGFDSVSAFGRAFGAMTGVTPSAFRQRARAGREPLVPTGGVGAFAAT